MHVVNPHWVSGTRRRCQAIAVLISLQLCLISSVQANHLTVGELGFPDTGAVEQHGRGREEDHNILYTAKTGDWDGNITHVFHDETMRLCFQEPREILPRHFLDLIEHQKSSYFRKTASMLTCFFNLYLNINQFVTDLSQIATLESRKSHLIFKNAPTLDCHVICFRNFHLMKHYFTYFWEGFLYLQCTFLLYFCVWMRCWVIPP